MNAKRLLLLWVVHMWVVFGSLYLAKLSVPWTMFQLALVLLPSVLLAMQTTDAKGRLIPPKKMKRIPGALVVDVPWQDSREAWRRTAILLPIGMLFSVLVSIYGSRIGLVTWWQRVFVLLSAGIAWQIYMIYKSRQWPDEDSGESPKRQPSVPR